MAGYLDHLERAGFGGAPRYLGRDARGRDVLTYLAGQVAGDPPEPWATADDLLASVAELLRRLHEASAGYLAGAGFATPSGGVWHRDRSASTCRTVAAPAGARQPLRRDTAERRRPGGARGGPGGLRHGRPASRLLDVVNTAMHGVPLRHPDDLAPHWRSLDVPARLRLFADTYGLDRAGREGFAQLAIARAAASRHRMRAAAEQLGGGWARMWSRAWATPSPAVNSGSRPTGPPWTPPSSPEGPDRGNRAAHAGVG